jgi:hypothetical protein
MMQYSQNIRRENNNDNKKDLHLTDIQILNNDNDTTLCASNPIQKSSTLTMPPGAANS